MKNMRVAIIDGKENNWEIYLGLFQGFYPLLRKAGVRFGKIQVLSNYRELREFSKHFLTGQKFLVISDTNLWDGHGHRSTLEVLEELAGNHEVVIYSSRAEKSMLLESCSQDDKRAIEKIDRLIGRGASYTHRTVRNFSNPDTFFSEVIEPVLK